MNTNVHGHPTHVFMGDAARRRGDRKAQQSRWARADVKPPTGQAGSRGIDAAFGFDFGSGQALPPPQPANRPSFKQGSAFVRLASRANSELLDYLTQRRVATGFLFEIDQFLAAHPELAEVKPELVEQINKLTPLRAYKAFIKGYTRPARYIPIAIPQINNDLPLPPVDLSVMVPLGQKYDEELVEFFDGYTYRYDILAKIDHEVRQLSMKRQYGHALTRPQRILIAYTVWGNPVDAYKYFEYNYQTEWLQHRYLPEHIALCDIAKPSDYTEPAPHVMAEPQDARPEGQRRYKDVRLRMARACDQKVDVIDVLMKEFVAEGAKRGLKRDEIHRLRFKASAALDQERDDPTGADIVDLVMDMVCTIPHRNPLPQQDQQDQQGQQNQQNQHAQQSQHSQQPQCAQQNQYAQYPQYPQYLQYSQYPQYPLYPQYGQQQPYQPQHAHQAQLQPLDVQLYFPTVRPRQQPEWRKKKITAANFLRESVRKLKRAYLQESIVAATGRPAPPDLIIHRELMERQYANRYIDYALMEHAMTNQEMCNLLSLYTPEKQRLRQQSDIKLDLLTLCPVDLS